MKVYAAMKVSYVGNVTEVVMGGNKHSGKHTRRSRSRSSYSFKGPRFR